LSISSVVRADFPYLLDEKYIGWSTEEVYDDLVKIGGSGGRRPNRMQGDVIQADPSDVQDAVGKVVAATSTGSAPRPIARRPRAPSTPRPIRSPTGKPHGRPSSTIGTAQTIQNQTGYFRPRDAPEAVGVSRATLYRWKKEGLIQVRKVRGMFFFAIADVRHNIEGVRGQVWGSECRYGKGA
jgi:hypothetical protein